MLSIRTKGDFYLFYDFHMVEFYLSTLNIATSHTLKRIKPFRKYTHILLFNYNAAIKAYSFIFNEDVPRNIIQGFNKTTPAPQWRYYGNLNATWHSQD